MFIPHHVSPCTVADLRGAAMDPPGVQILSISVADPGFFPGGAPTPKLGLICNFFAENCMKMKEFGPLGGAHPWRPLRSANEFHAVSGRIWHNRMLPPPPTTGGLASPPRGNPGSPTAAGASLISA